MEKAKWNPDSFLYSGNELMVMRNTGPAIMPHPDIVI
jgi:hypothetical protein